MKKLLFTIVAMSQISFSQWVQTSGLYDLRSVNVLGVYGSSLWAGIEGGGMWMTNDNGDSWSTMNKGLTNSHVFSLTVSGNNLFVGTQTGVFVFNNNDSSWTALGPYTNYVKGLASSETWLFAATSGSGVYRSSNNGTNWTAANSGLGDLWVRNVAISNGTMFAATQSGGVYRSTNSGTTWTAINSGLGNLWTFALMATGSNLLFVATSAGVFYSSDGGDNWKIIESGLPTSILVTCFAESDGVLFAGTMSNKIYVSTDNSIHWSESNRGLEDPYIYIASLGVVGRYLFAGTGSNWIWRRPIGEFLSVHDGCIPPPESYDLKQNYPNPFNPSTNISFSIPSKCFVSLKIFNLLGKEIVTIVNEELSPGNYVKQWNSEKNPSGIYFCRIYANGFSKTRELILLR